jgi:hypothetical protein
MDCPPTPASDAGQSGCNGLLMRLMGIAGCFDTTGLRKYELN